MLKNLCIFAAETDTEVRNQKHISALRFTTSGQDVPKMCEETLSPRTAIATSNARCWHAVTYAKISSRSSSDVGNAGGFSNSKAQRERFAEYYAFSATNATVRDEETGFGYFGARYMDHELMTMWLSVDPMSDKYPSLSPYSYCAWTRPTGGDEHRWIKYNTVNNPVRLVDPDGRDWYKYTEVKNNKSHTYYSWKEGHAKSINVNGKNYKNVGAFASIRGKDGKYTNYYQNERISYSTQSQTTRELSHFLFSREGARSRTFLFGKNSHLSTQSKKELMQGRVSSGHQFYNDAFNIACSTISTTLSTTGTVVTAVGTGLTATGVGAEVGVPMIGLGNIMTDVGTSIVTIQDFVNGDKKWAVVNLAAVLAGRCWDAIPSNPSLTNRQKNFLKGCISIYLDLIPNAKPLKSN